MLSSTNFANFTKKTANFTISNFVFCLNAIMILEKQTTLLIGLRKEGGECLDAITSVLCNTAKS